MTQVSHNSPDAIINLEANYDFLGEIPCYEPFEYVVNYICPLYSGSGTTDVSYNALKKKESWEKKMKTIHLSDIKAAIRTIKKLRRNNQPLKVSKNLMRFIHHIRRDPEPHFTGKYNWLYTGGTLQNIRINDSIILLGADKNTLSTHLNVLKCNEDFSKIIHKTKCSLKKNSQILQVSCKAKQSDIITAVRQKNFISILKLNESCDTNDCDKWRKKVQSTKFFTSLDIASDCHTVIAADSKQDLHLFDIESRKKLYGYSHKVSTRDNWNQVLSVDNIIYMANRDVLSVIDTRDPYTTPVFEYNPSNATNLCEDICSLIKSETDSNYVYLGTSHNVIQVDGRSRKSVQRWTHLMKTPPLFLSCVKDNSSDLLTLQSNHPNETFGITNECKKEEDATVFLSKSLPCAFLNVKECLRLARLKGIALLPATAKRFEFSVTGIQSLKSEKGDFYLLTINSGGDIFVSHIVNKKCSQKTGKNFADIEELEFLNKMNSFEQHLSKIYMGRPQKKVREEINLEHIPNDLMSIDLSSCHTDRKATLWKKEEMFSNESLCMYRDVMSKKILQIWGGQSDENEINDSISYEAKVEEWMKKM
ncbi:hypothetical protein RUM44_004322 [Polyplax serrata]|uniref:Uncharacterized protein n=1 Tax=Polyplax serrata TaxID=468196 RepID=A0ABR1B2J7_POLSC